MQINLKSRALKIVEFAQRIKALNSVVLDLRKISNFCDYFVILTGTSKTHIKSIADGINEGLRKEGIRINHAEGYEYSKWIILDYSSVIVHIFDEQTRNFYDLEHLWADAPNVLTKTKRKRTRY